MITELRDTTASKISSALLRGRRAQGSPAMGMVMTLIIACDEDESETAIDAATTAAREHPSRILVVIAAGGRTTQLDAELRIGEGSPGEILILRMSGQTATHAASVVRPLLLPDSPVVVWWPGTAPARLAEHELGQLADRRVTDAMGAARPQQALRVRADDYRPGDTDLTWTRITQWRSLLAAALDQYPATVLSASVTAERSSAAANLLVSWLESRLRVPVSRRVSDGPGITGATLTTPAGDIAIERPDGKLATYMVPGQPKRSVALKRRQVSDLISEELRRMDPDDIFEQTLTALRANAPAGRRARSTTTKRATSGAGSKGTKSSAAKKAATKSSAAKQSGARPAAAKRAGAKQTAKTSAAPKASAQRPTKKAAAKKATTTKPAAKKAPAKRATTKRAAKKTTTPRKTAASTSRSNG